MKIGKRYNAKLIQIMITIGAHWSPLELEIEKRGSAELIQIMITIGTRRQKRGRQVSCLRQIHKN